MIKRSVMVALGTFLYVLVWAQTTAPLRLAVAGTSHGHAGWILSRQKADVQLVGIWEPDQTLAVRRQDQFKLSADLFFPDLLTMLDKVKPEAVVAFGSILEHKIVVQACAPRRIHVMVEKPLATTYKDALDMSALAKQHGIFLLTNYETSWYPTTERTFQLTRDLANIGSIRKVVVHDGHRGPLEIGVGQEFLQWLTDPVLNGGGALIDFGCYGANLMTYLMQGQKPVAVTAITRQFKPDIYSRVDDDATIIVDYADAQGIFQASWNWPFSRKDMEVYGTSGYIFAPDRSTLRWRRNEKAPEQVLSLTAEETGVYTDPFSYFSEVIRGQLKPSAFSPYTLENNLLVVQILDAARRSAKTGKRVVIRP